LVLNSDSPMTKKIRMLFRLVSAKSNAQWLTIRDLAPFGPRPYLYRVLAGLEKEGYVARRWARPAKGKPMKSWQATEAGDSLLSHLPEGQLPRAPLPRAATARTIEVMNYPLDSVLDVKNAWTENVRLNLTVQPIVADALRGKLDPPGKEDKAEQYSLITETFALTINKNDLASVILKKVEWSTALTELCLVAGLSRRTTATFIALIYARLPASIARVEIPLLAHELKEFRQRYKITTRVLKDRKPTGKVIQSNINYSTLVDWESIGKLHLVDTFLSVMSAMQHNAVFAQEVLEDRAKEEAEKREQEQIEAEKKLAEDQAKAEELRKETEQKEQAERAKKEAQYIG